MKILVLYPYPPEPDGQSLQGHYLVQGLRELGHQVMQCDPQDNMQKRWTYRFFRPDVCIGVGFWGDTPRVVLDPLKSKIVPVPWFNADGWVANYQDTLNQLPLIVATSNWVRSTYIRDGVAGDRIKVVPIGFDPNVFRPLPESDPGRLEVRKMLGIKKDEKMILTIGGDVTSKGAQEIFQALANINEEHPKWKYVCKVWDSFSAWDHGAEEKALLKKLGLTKKVRYLKGKFSPGFISQLLNACDIYAAPSRLEGVGMIQLEAQACGKPVVSINVGGPRDTIVHGKTGFLVDVAHEVKLDREWVYKHMGFKKKMQIEFPVPKTFAYRADIGQLSACLAKLLSDDALAVSMGKAAADHALHNFHYRTVAQQMVDAITENVVKGKQASKEISLISDFSPL